MNGDLGLVVGCLRSSPQSWLQRLSPDWNRPPVALGRKSCALKLVEKVEERLKRAPVDLCSKVMIGHPPLGPVDQCLGQEWMLQALRAIGPLTMKVGTKMFFLSPRLCIRGSLVSFSSLPSDDDGRLKKKEVVVDDDVVERRKKLVEGVFPAGPTGSFDFGSGSSAVTLTEHDLEMCAGLAGLALPSDEGERSRVEGDFQSMVGFLASVKSVSVPAEAKPMTSLAEDQPTHVRGGNGIEQDGNNPVVGKAVEVGTVVGQARVRTGSYFVVPKVIGGENA